MQHDRQRPRGVGVSGLGLAVAALALLACAACGPKVVDPPRPGESTGIAPVLRGRTVLLLPVQVVAGVAGDADAELAYALKDRGGDVSWIEEDAILESLRRSPGIDARTRGLPVGQFQAAQVRRIGDPLYGQIRRMSALFDADAVLLPVSATFQPNEEVIGSGPRVRLTVALIEPRTGQVVWFAVEEGGEFDPGDPRGLASAVETVARALLWYVG